MQKKRKMSNGKFYELNAETLADLYTNRPSRKRVIIDDFVNTLHEMQLDFVDEALEKSNLKEANEVIKYIMEKK